MNGFHKLLIIFLKAVIIISAAVSITYGVLFFRTYHYQKKYNVHTVRSYFHEVALSLDERSDVVTLLDDLYEEFREYSIPLLIYAADRKDNPYACYKLYLAVTDYFKSFDASVPEDTREYLLALLRKGSECPCDGDRCGVVEGKDSCANILSRIAETPNCPRK